MTIVTGGLLIALLWVIISLVAAFIISRIYYWLADKKADAIDKIGYENYLICTKQTAVADPFDDKDSKIVIDYLQGYWDLNEEQQKRLWEELPDMQ
jgi:hypothetical protein